MDKSSPSLIRTHNEHLLLETLSMEGQLSRADLSRQTGLNKASVSEIIADLLASGLILETGSGESRGGRRPVLLEVNGKRAVALAVNLAPDEITAVASWLDGRPATRTVIQEVPVTREDAAALILQTVNSLLDSLSQKCGPAGLPEIAGLAVAIHGNVYENEILFTPYYDLSGLHLADELSRALGCPVFLGNEANFAALGVQGCEDPGEDFISLTIHSGIGGGLIRGGQLDRGQQGFSGEIGHMIVVPDGQLCPCGNSGCIEQYASDRALRQLYRERSGMPDASFRQMLAAYRHMDPAAIFCVRQFTSYMAILINNIIRLLDPAQVVLHSRLTAALPEIIPAIERRIKCRIKSGTVIRNSELGDRAILYGCVYAVARSFYGIGQLRLKP